MAKSFPVHAPSKKDNTQAHNALVKQIEAYLLWLGGWVMKVWGGPMQRPGLPDNLGCLKGRLLAIEVKTGTGKLSLKQLEEKARLEQAGAIYIEARSLDDVEARLIAEGLAVKQLF